MFRNFTFIFFFSLLLVSSLVLRNFSDVLNRALPFEFSSFYDLIKEELGFVSEQVISSTIYTSLDRIEGLKRLDREQIKEILGIYEGMEINPELLVDLENNIKSISWIDSFSYSREVFPQRLKLKIIEAEPAFVAEYEEESWLVSKKGTLLQRLSEIKKSSVVMEVSSLPRLYGIDPKFDNKSYLSSVSERLSYVLKNLEFLELAGGLPFKYTAITLINGGGIEIETSEESNKEFKLPKKIFFQVRSLQDAKSTLSRLDTILNDLKLRGETPSELDFRFKDQAVVR